MDSAQVKVPVKESVKARVLGLVLERARALATEREMEREKVLDLAREREKG